VQSEEVGSVDTKAVNAVGLKHLEHTRIIVGVFKIGGMADSSAGVA